MPKIVIRSRENASNLVLVDGKVVADLCRCGHSANKPYCDSSHRTHGFVAPATEIVLLE
ncbi:MAG TPA: CDGSH iron-sulfur domain-containing protein [Thermoplasmata archaeon]|nr:CDGSH iron-sulfur domain-containing protein [Thermoplasmata archaeon]